MNPTVVILLSDKRSGSTMFELELCRHPDIRHVDYTPHTYNETHHWLKAACVLNRPAHLFHGGKVYPGYGSRMGARQYLIDGILGNAPDFDVPEDDEQLVFEGWETLCQTFAKPVFFEKSPQYSAHWAALDLILKWMEITEFEVRFIGLVRNPMGVMYSANQLFFTDPAKRQFSWADTYRNILSMKEMVGSGQFHMVRYEDLVSKPREVFDRVCDFIGVERSPEIGKGVHGESTNKWVNDPDFILQLDESVARLAGHFGYEKTDLENPKKSGPTHLKKLSRKLEGFLRLTKARSKDRVLKPLAMKMRSKKRE